MTDIADIAARMILDSRGNPTVEVDVILDDGIARRIPLLLASAPAGSGKSTLLASWASRQAAQVAWLQVEDGDSDPARFWSSLVAAIA